MNPGGGGSSADAPGASPARWPPLAPASPEPHLTALRNSRDRLSVALSSLNQDQLAGPSYDDDWSIGQVASHLGSQAEIYRSLPRRGAAAHARQPAKR
ncbi:MAG: maleylpyruvate isomerase N-terminal domain-containing protein [Nocardioidaceae bacterium]